MKRGRDHPNLDAAVRPDLSPDTDAPDTTQLISPRRWPGCAARSAIWLGVGFYLQNASGMLTQHGQVTTLVMMVFFVVLAVEAIATYLRWVFK